MRVELIRRYILDDLVVPTETGRYRMTKKMFSRWAAYRKEAEFFLELFSSAIRVKDHAENVVDIDDLAK